LEWTGRLRKSWITPLAKDLPGALLFVLPEGATSSKVTLQVLAQVAEAGDTWFLRAFFFEL
jgi:hypothetical protein